MQNPVVNAAKKTGLSTFLFSAVLVAGLQPAHAATLNLNDLPLFLLENSSPNVILTMDDSGSMGWGYLPDGISGSRTQIYARASHFNKLYYDPQIDYRPGVNSNGQSLGNGYAFGDANYTAEADFNRVATNIFNYGNDSTSRWSGSDEEYIDLSNEFRGPWGGSSFSNSDDSAHYYRFDSTVAGCDPNDSADDTNTACYVRVNVSATSGPSRERPELGFAVTTDERINFANWFQYYSYRLIAAKTVASLAYAPGSLASNVRIARQAINRQNGDGPRSGAWSTGDSGNDRVATLTNTERSDFYNWLFNVRASGGTPLRRALDRAGDFYTDSGTNSPYVLEPGGSSPDNSTELSCRLNTHILITDGYYNGGMPTISSFSPDQTAVTLPDGVGYTPGTPLSIYGDTINNTLADIAFHYWATDLRTGLTNNVPEYKPFTSGNAVQDYWNPRNDPATWQHMVNFTITFGLAGDLPGETDADGTNVYQQLLTGGSFLNSQNQNQTGWWYNNNVTNRGRADDLYHSAINSRGQFFNATNPAELVRSLETIMNSISDRLSSASSVDLNSGSIAAGVGLYQARFQTSDWSGQLLVRPISDGSGTDSCSLQATGTVCDAEWDAGAINTLSTLFPAGVDARKTFTYDGTAALGARGKQFVWSQLSAPQQSILRDGDSTTVGQDRLNYIRGSAAQEERNGGIFRDRPPSRLGAVVHSSPEYVGDGFQANGRFDTVYPDGLEGTGAQNHRDFICTNPTDTDMNGLVDSCASGSIRGRTPIVYVGGNDGMLHAYNAKLSTAAGGGQELFNYVPNAVYSKVHKLSDPTFVTGSSVDGELDSRDVYYDNAWHTLLVGGLRTGGQAYFALDITHADQINAQSDALADQLVRWEFGDTNTTAATAGTAGVNGDTDMGQSYGEPIIGKSNFVQGAGNTGRWVAMFGNGYNSTFADGSASTTGHGVIYVVDIETGLLLKKFDTGVGSIANPNGIANVTPIFNDDNEGLTLDYIYAGDLYGNMWKIDISSTDVADWDFAYASSGSPAPLFSASASAYTQPITSTPIVGEHPLGGNVVYFGTGKYLEDTDNGTTPQESFYAIWDKDECSAGPCSDDTLTGLAKTHIAQSFDRTNLLQQTVDQSSTNSRTTTDLQIDWSSKFGWYLDLVQADGERAVGKPILSGGALFFTSVVPDTDLCSSGGDSWLYALDRLDGGRAGSQVFDHNNDGTLDSSDYLNGDITSASKISGIASDPTVILGRDDFNYILTGTSDTSTNANVNSQAVWNEFNGYRVRWRQIK